MAGLTEFYCGWNEHSHASQFKWLEYTFKCISKIFNSSVLLHFSPIYEYIHFSSGTFLSPSFLRLFPFILCSILSVLSDSTVLYLKGQCHEIFDFCFFHESVSPKPLSIPTEPFRIFSKICWAIRSSRCSTGVADTGGKWQKSSNWKILIILFGHLSLIPVVHLDLQLSPRIFEKIWNGPNAILWGWGKLIHK